MSIRASIIVIAALAVVAGVAIAQQSPPVAPQSAPAAAPNQKAAANMPAVPHPDQLMILIRSTLLAANQANLTGNYTVLRELGTPDFQQTNSAARLAEIFRDLRSRNIDISPVAVLDAKLLRQPSIDANGRLLLSGFFPSQPEQVNFDLLFQMMGGRWRLFGIRLTTTRNETPVAATGATAQPATPPTGPDSEPEAIKKPTAAATDSAAPPMTPAEKKAASEKKEKSSAAPTEPASAAKAPPDVKDKVDKLEASPAQQTQPKPKESYNPLGGF